MNLAVLLSTANQLHSWLSLQSQWPIESDALVQTKIIRPPGVEPSKLCPCPSLMDKHSVPFFCGVVHLFKILLKPLKIQSSVNMQEAIGVSSNISLEVSFTECKTKMDKANFNFKVDWFFNEISSC